MAEIVLTVDASQAKQALNSVNQAITQAKINGATITIDGSNATKQVKNIDKAVKQTAQTIDKTTTEQANNATKGIKSVTNQFGKGVGQIRGFLNGTVSYWTAVIVALELASKALKYFWNNLTQTTQKMMTRGQNVIKIAQLSKKKIQQETSASQALISKLIELNKLQQMNFDQKRLAEAIIAKLNSQYKNLGITLDETTGKYRGLYQAQIMIDQRNKTSQASALKRQITAQRDIINASLKNAGLSINIGQMISGDDLMSIAEKIGKTLGSKNSDILAKKWNTGDIVKQLEVIDQLLNGLSSDAKFMQNGSVVRDAMQALIDYKQQLEDLNSVNNQIFEAENRLTDAFKAQRDALKATREQTERLNKSFEDQQRESSLEGLDPEDRANALKAEVEQLRKKNDEIQETQKLREEQSRYINSDANSDRRAFDQINEKRKALEERIKDLDAQQKTRRDRAARYATVDQNANKVTGNAFISREYFDKHFRDANFRDKVNSEIQQFLTQRAHGPVNPKDLDDLRQMLKYVEDYNGLISQEVTLQYQLTKAKDQLTSLNEKAKEHQMALSQSEAKRLQHQQSIADLQKQRAQNMTAIQAKEKQIADIEAQISKERAEAELRTWQLTQDFVNDLMKKQIDGLNEILGKKQESLLLELQLNAEKIKGRKLTEEQVEALKSYVDVMSMQDQFKANQKLGFETNGVITNDLARKGGWASSVVVDRAQDINKQILNTQRTQVEVLSQLKETMDKSNELLKEFSVIQ